MNIEEMVTNAYKNSLIMLLSTYSGKDISSENFDDHVTFEDHPQTNGDIKTSVKVDGEPILLLGPTEAYGASDGANVTVTLSRQIIERNMR